MENDKAKDESACEAGPATQVQTSRIDGDVEKQAPEAIKGNTESDRPLLHDAKQSAFKSLGLLDRFLAVWILLAMVVGVILGNFVPNIAQALEKGEFAGVSVPIGESTFSFMTRFEQLQSVHAIRPAGAGLTY